MILRQYQSLGLLPELITFVFLAAAVATLALVALRVCWRTPVALVPNSIGAGELAPARADDDYCKAFAANFLAHWATWNEHTFRHRAHRAIELMTPTVRPGFVATVERAASLVASLSQTQVMALDQLTVQTFDAARGVHGVVFSGTLKSFYGGVGGDPEPYRGELLLRATTPTAQRPLCLEVIGFVITRADVQESP
ncbi:MAG: hypothetical protein H0X45_12745 [Planctomycetes bacterium]|nr:hypothetical protein [Planctomycetota bacterium]